MILANLRNRCRKIRNYQSYSHPRFKLHLEDHREQFATLLQVCGPLFHVQVVDPGPPATVDAYCGDMTQVVSETTETIRNRER